MQVSIYKQDLKPTGRALKNGETHYNTIWMSHLAYELKDFIAEIDINPVIVNPNKATAVDALILTRRVFG